MTVRVVAATAGLMAAIALGMGEVAAAAPSPPLDDAVLGAALKRTISAKGGVMPYTFTPKGCSSGSCGSAENFKLSGGTVGIFWGTPATQAQLKADQRAAINPRPITVNGNSGAQFTEPGPTGTLSVVAVLVTNKAIVEVQAPSSLITPAEEVTLAGDAVRSVHAAGF